jgi:hypothetical protein
MRLTSLEALGQQVAARLVADVWLPPQRVGGRAGHYHLDPTRAVLVRVPVRAQACQGLVERDADAPTHTDDHRLAVQRRHPVFEVLHQVRGHPVEPLLGPDQGLDGGPFALQALLLAVGLVLGEVGNLRVDDQLGGVRQLDAGEAALVVDRHRRAVRDRAADVVDVDIVAEHGRGVHVVLLDRRAGEADEGGVGQAGSCPSPGCAR